MVNKWTEILLHMDTTKYSIVGICETWLHNDDVGSFTVHGYTHYAASRSVKLGGGVILYINSLFKSKLIFHVTAI